MQIELRHQPSFSVARLHLDAGEAVRAQSGAMAMHSDGITIESQMRGGLMGALKRSVLGGESFFVTTFSASRTAWVDVAAVLPGDLQVAELTSWLTSLLPFSRS